MVQQKAPGSTTAQARSGAPSPLQRLRLRWLVFGLTLLGAGSFALLAVVDRRAAPVALAGSLLVAVKGAGWLLYLRHKRAVLRRHGYRW